MWRSTLEAAKLGSDSPHLAPLHTLPKNPFQGSYEREGKEMYYRKGKELEKGISRTETKQQGKSKLGKTRSPDDMSSSRF